MRPNLIARIHGRSIYDLDEAHRAYRRLLRRLQIQDWICMAGTVAGFLFLVAIMLFLGWSLATAF